MTNGRRLNDNEAKSKENTTWDNFIRPLIVTVVGGTYRDHRRRTDPELYYARSQF